MPPAARCRTLLLAASLAVVGGCRRAPPAERAAVLAAEISAVRTQCPADPSAEHAESLERPAKLAARAYTALSELAARNPQEPSIVAAREAAEADYVVVRHAQRLACERRDVAALLSGLKVRGYRAARTVAVPKLLDALASAARKAADADIEKLPRLVREAAELAAVLADVSPPASESPAASPAPLTRADWLIAAQRLESFSAAEPGEFPLGLGLAYTMLGKGGFALVEFERAEGARFDRPELATLVPLARALTFSRLGCTELAAREASRISGDDERGRQLLAVIHAALAYCHAAEKDWKQMDRELGEAVRIWPNNPLVVYLAGERLLADGRREQALETFARTAGPDAAWLAPLVEHRIRAVRDSQGAVPPLVLDHAFLAKAALLACAAEARQTPTGRKLAAFLATVDLLPHLLGAEESATPAASPATTSS
ncbi:MAG TPA: hypothetical protein VK178_13830 [Opitutaceae bacterium]|nr:hypothetical protein [Opitutaceae bacterium]